MEEIDQHWGNRLRFRRRFKITSDILLGGKIFYKVDFCMQLLRWWRLHVLFHFPCYQLPCLDLRQRSGPSHSHESCIEIWYMASYFQCLYEGVWCASWQLDNLDQQYVHYTVTLVFNEVKQLVYDKCCHPTPTPRTCCGQYCKLWTIKQNIMLILD